MASTGAALRARRLRAARLAVIVLIAGTLLAACGGSSADGGAGGGGAAGGGSFEAVIPLIAKDFGTAMVSAADDNGTLKITLVDGAGSGMAKLFMCANVRPRLKEAGLDGAKVVIVEQSGKQLSTEADCKS